jgi:hypothetical protein
VSSKSEYVHQNDPPLWTFFRRLGRAGYFRHEPDFDDLLHDQCLPALVAMHRRVHQGRAAVTIQEYWRLEGWISEHEEKLTRLAGPSGVLTLGKGRRVTLKAVRTALDQGPRDLSITETIEGLRELEQLYGGEVSPG